MNMEKIKQYRSDLAVYQFKKLHQPKNASAEYMAWIDSCIARSQRVLDVAIEMMRHEAK